MVMIIIRAYNAENTQVKLYNMYLENLNALKRYQVKYWYVTIEDQRMIQIPF